MSEAQITLSYRFNFGPTSDFISTSLQEKAFPEITHVFCETQCRNSMKTRLYNTPPPYFILWNAVTSLGENKVI